MAQRWVAALDEQFDRLQDYINARPMNAVKVFGLTGAMVVAVGMLLI